MWRAKVVYRPEANADVQRILTVVTERSGSAIVARRFVDRILAHCEKIGDAPHGGRPRDDLAPGLRTVPFERVAVIFYCLTDVVVISNVFYGGRDYEALYRPSEDAS